MSREFIQTIWYYYNPVSACLRWNAISALTPVAPPFDGHPEGAYAFVNGGVHGSGRRLGGSCCALITLIFPVFFRRRFIFCYR